MSVPPFNLAEPDAEFRKRILVRVNPKHKAIIYMVQIASTTALDLLGKGYGLVRDIGPIIDGEYQLRTPE